jgi:hypothetical protein
MVRRCLQNVIQENLSQIRSDTNRSVCARRLKPASSSSFSIECRRQKNAMCLRFFRCRDRNTSTCLGRDRGTHWASRARAPNEGIRTNMSNRRVPRRLVGEWSASGLRPLDTWSQAACLECLPAVVFWGRSIDRPESNPGLSRGIDSSARYRNIHTGH